MDNDDDIDDNDDEEDGQEAENDFDDPFGSQPMYVLNPFFVNFYQLLFQFCHCLPFLPIIRSRRRGNGKNSTTNSSRLSATFLRSFIKDCMACLHVYCNGGEREDDIHALVQHYILI